MNCTTHHTLRIALLGLAGCMGWLWLLSAIQVTWPM